jgi:hypothetical protein
VRQAGNSLVAYGELAIDGLKPTVTRITESNNYRADSADPEVVKSEFLASRMPAYSPREKETIEIREEGVWVRRSCEALSPSDVQLVLFLSFLARKHPPVWSR